MKLKAAYLILLLTILGSCEDSNGTSPSNENTISSFEILEYQLDQPVIDGTKKTIDFVLVFGAPIDQLVVEFIVSEGASVFVNDVEQISGITRNDFTKPLKYVVLAEDKTTKAEWIVTANIEEEPKFSVSTLVADYLGNDGISVDSDDNIYVNSNGLVNQWNGTTIHKVTPTGEVSLFHENLPPWPVGSIFDNDENLYVTGWGAPGIITKISHDGSSSEQIVSGIGEPSGLEIDNEGNIYVMEPPTNSMLKINLQHEKSTFASGGSFNKASGIAFDKINEVFYITNWNDGVISLVNMEGEINTFVSLPVRNLGPIIIVDDYLYTTNPNGNRVYRINISSKEIELMAGTGTRGNKDGYGNVATFAFPLGVAVSNDKSKIYVSEVSPTGTGRLRVITFNK